MINQFSLFFVDKKGRFLIAWLGSSALFSLAHFAEGPMGLVTNGVFGLVLGASYLLSGRNLWVTIIAHGLANTLRFVLLYLGAF